MGDKFRFTPYRRSTIGFDRLFDLLDANAGSQGGSHPPFDIERQGGIARSARAGPGCSRPPDLHGPFAVHGLIADVAVSEWDPILGAFNGRSSMPGQIHGNCIKPG